MNIIKYNLKFLYVFTSDDSRSRCPPRFCSCTSVVITMFMSGGAEAPPANICSVSGCRMMTWMSPLSPVSTVLVMVKVQSQREAALWPLWISTASKWRGAKRFATTRRRGKARQPQVRLAHSAPLQTQECCFYSGPGARFRKRASRKIRVNLLWFKRNSGFSVSESRFSVTLSQLPG